MLGDLVMLKIPRICTLPSVRTNGARTHPVAFCWHFWEGGREIVMRCAAGVTSLLPLKWAVV